MTITTLSTLRSRMKADMWITGTERDSQIDDAIRSALRQYRKKRFWFLKGFTTLTVLAGGDSVALPVDYSCMENDNHNRNFFAVMASNGSTWVGLPQKDSDEFYNRFRNQVATPTQTSEACWIDEASKMLNISHVTASDLPVRITYYKQDEALPEGDDATSLWFDDGLDAIRSLAMFIFKRDSDGYTATEEDGALADSYFSQLCQQAQRLEL